MATQQRLDEITQQLEDRIFEETGKTISLKPKEYSVSNRLSWAEIVARFEDGEPINEGELLPEVPKEGDITASTFYRATKISPTTFSQMPFSNFKRDIAGARVQERSPAEKEDDKVLASHIKGLEQEMNESAYGGDDESEDLGVIGYGPDSQPAVGLLGMVPGIGTLVSTISGVAQGMAAVIYEGLGGPPSGYEAYAQLDDIGEASRAYSRGEITAEQLEGFMRGGGGKYAADGTKVTGARYEAERRAKEAELWKDDYGSAAAYYLGKEEDNRDIQDIITTEIEANIARPADQRSWFEAAIEGSTQPGTTFNPNTVMPSDVIGYIYNLEGKTKAEQFAEGIGVTKKGYWTAKDGYFKHHTHNPHDPKDVRDAAKTTALAVKIRAGDIENNLPTDFIDALTDGEKTTGGIEDYSLEPGAFGHKGAYVDTEGDPGTDDGSIPSLSGEGVARGDQLESAKPESGSAPADDDDDVTAPDDTDPGLDWGYGFIGGDPGDPSKGLGDVSWWYADDDDDAEKSWWSADDAAELHTQSFERDTPAETPPDAPHTFVDTEGDPGTDDGVDGVDGAEDTGAGTEDSWDAAGGYWHSGGLVGMQEGGDIPLTDDDDAMMEDDDDDDGGNNETEGEMANLGIVKDEQASPPQRGGQRSVRDDIPREADAGDYILPYETVLIMGLKQLNRYAREAIQLAIKNNIDLGGTDLDPTDDVPIVVSNYEYHIPKVLVPFFGGGKKYLDKIRNEGLALRKRLAEEKKKSAGRPPPPPPSQPAAPSPQQQQQQPAAPAEAAGQEAPPPPPPVAESQIPQEVSMMQKGGFVLDSKERTLPTTEAILEADVSQVQQSAYNQMQALKRSQKQQQQPPMVDPTGKIKPQGFAAPQGYQRGAVVEQDRDLAQAAEPKSKPPLPDWANRALDPKTPTIINEDGTESTVKTMMHPMPNGDWIVFPSIRMKGKNLIEHKDQKALSIALDKQDYVRFKNKKKALNWSKNLSEQIGKLRDIQKPPEDIITDLPPPSSLPQEQGFAPQPRMP